MSTIQTTLTDQQQRSQLSDTGTDVIFTANGSKKASRKVWRTGAYIGFESLNTRPPRELDVEFIDWPFTKLEDYTVEALFEKHLNVVAAERPKYAVAPDVDDRVSFDQAIEYADQLAEHAETVIVAPKITPPESIPDRFRVGMPCQERYGAPWWQWTRYEDVEEVHLLGGSPKLHKEILKYYVPVRSVDTVVPVKTAQFGSYWDGEQWQKSDSGFYWALQASYRALRQMLNRGVDLWDPRCRNRKHDYVQDFKKNHPDADLIAAGEDPPVHGRVAFGPVDE